MDTYTKRERTIYLLGMLGQNLIYGVIGTGLTYYFQSVIFLPALAISTITLLSKIAEFLCDPYVGMPHLSYIFAAADFYFFAALLS